MGTVFQKEELLMSTIIEENCDIFGVSEVDLQFFHEKERLRSKSLLVVMTRSNSGPLSIKGGLSQ